LILKGLNKMLSFKKKINNFIFCINFRKKLETRLLFVLVFFLTSSGCSTREEFNANKQQIEESELDQRLASFTFEWKDIPVCDPQCNHGWEFEIDRKKQLINFAKTNSHFYGHKFEYDTKSQIIQFQYAIPYANGLGLYEDLKDLARKNKKLHSNRIDLDFFEERMKILDKKSVFRHAFFEPSEVVELSNKCHLSISYSGYILRFKTNTKKDIDQRLHSLNLNWKNKAEKNVLNNNLFVSCPKETETSNTNQIEFEQEADLDPKALAIIVDLIELWNNQEELKLSNPTYFKNATFFQDNFNLDKTKKYCYGLYIKHDELPLKIFRYTKPVSTKPST